MSIERALPPRPMPSGRRDRIRAAYPDCVVRLAISEQRSSSKLPFSDGPGPPIDDDHMRALNHSGRGRSDGSVSSRRRPAAGEAQVSERCSFVYSQPQPRDGRSRVAPHARHVTAIHAWCCNPCRPDLLFVGYSCGASCFSTHDSPKGMAQLRPVP